MGNEREPKLGVAVGKKGVGKTFETDRMIKDYVYGNPTQGVPGRRVLIMDINDEYVGVPALDPKNVRLFSAQRFVEARRIRPIRSDGNKMTLDEFAGILSSVLQNFRSGLLLLEDINKYISDNLPGDVIGAICTNRHTDTDIIMHFQSIGRITPKIWQNMNWLRFHKNTDAVSRHKNKFSDKLELFSLAELIVDHQYMSGNKRYFCFVDVEDEKIRGNVTEAMKREAIEDYIEANFRALVKSKIGTKVRGGNYRHTEDSARKFAYKRINDYYFI